MTIGVLLSLAIAAVPPTTTDEAFSLRPSEVSGPCYVKIQGKAIEEPPPPCAAAIAAARTPKEKAILYFEWAYSLNEADSAIQALPNLDKAVALAPNFANARHERGYTLSDLGFYERALIDLDRQIELEPQSADAYSERAFSRHPLADFEGALADRLKVIELAGSNHDREVAVARELMWLGRYDEAYKRLSDLSYTGDQELLADIDRRREFKPDGGEAKRCALAQSVDNPAAAEKMVDDCSWAFDHEKDPAKRADYLTVRRVASVVAKQDRETNFIDLQIAAALDPTNPERHINLGNYLVDVRHSWAARNEFEIALANPKLSRRDRMMALAGRGRARANLGDIAGAMSDAKASYEIEPGMANIWLAGDLAYHDGNKEAAKRFWLMIYRMGIRDDSLIKSLKSVGVEDPEKEPRQ